MNAGSARILTMAFSVAAVIFSSIVHEVAHGYVALRCGDPTAKEAGRLTLNPAAHLDPFGSVILPLLMAYLGGPVFAYAKPVPYNPYRLKSRNRDEFLVALAGPVSNILQAVLGALAFYLCYQAWSGAYDALYWVCQLLVTYVYVNCVLAFFNLIPLPPLDGSKVVSLFLRGPALDRYYELQRYSMAILLAVLYLAPMVLKVDLLGIYLDATAGSLADLLLGWGA